MSDVGFARSLGASPLTQPPLPWRDDALEPVISARTIGFHHGKHHKGYFDTLATLVAGTELAEMTLEEIIARTAGDPARIKIFNNAGQCWNHNFYWQSLSPERQTPRGELAAAINRDFGGLDECRKQLAATATGHFGTGWGWLVVDRGTLKTVSTDDADVPFVHGQVPLLTIDVWEHAYYLDVQNRRADHVTAVAEAHLNWEFAAANYERALTATVPQ